MRLHEQNREAVPKHSLPPQEQILSYMGRFINCPYGTPENCPGYFSQEWPSLKSALPPSGTRQIEVTHEVLCTIQYGIDAAIFEIGWYSRLLYEWEEQA